MKILSKRFGAFTFELTRTELHEIKNALIVRNNIQSRAIIEQTIKLIEKSLGSEKYE